MQSILGRLPIEHQLVERASFFMGKFNARSRFQQLRNRDTTHLKVFTAGLLRLLPRVSFPIWSTMSSSPARSQSEP